MRFADYITIKRILADELKSAGRRMAACETMAEYLMKTVEPL